MLFLKKLNKLIRGIEYHSLKSEDKKLIFINYKIIIILSSFIIKGYYDGDLYENN